MKIEIASDFLEDLLLHLPPAQAKKLSEIIHLANQKVGYDQRKKYLEFCQHYELPPQAKDSKEQYEEYRRQLKIFEPQEKQIM